MLLKKWEDMPVKMQNDKVRPYYDILAQHKAALVLKRCFDIVGAVCLFMLFFPLMVVVGIAVRLDSPGNIFFRQDRITAYGKKFRIWKFRSMVLEAEKKGTQITTDEDWRVTKVGRFIRKYRLDELPQLINILAGDMTFVGVRPEVEKFVDHYTDEMYATLLLPAGVTSEATIRYKDEISLLKEVIDIDDTYVKYILPGKMYYNLKAIREFGMMEDIKIIIRTVFAVFGKEYADIREDMVYGKNPEA